eukprot:426856-Amphidinium_carterae.2
MSTGRRNEPSSATIQVFMPLLRCSLVAQGLNGYGDVSLQQWGVYARELILRFSEGGVVRGLYA